MLGELLLVDVELLLLHELVEHELGLDALDRGLAGLVLELLLGLALDLQVLREVQAHLAQLVVLEVVLTGVDLVLEQLLGDGDLDQLEQLVQDALLGLRGLVVLLHVLQALAAVRLQLLEGVELGGELGEVVVQLGQLTLGDLGDLDGDLGLLAGRRAALQLGGEGGLATGLQALHGVVDAVQQLTGADGVGDAAGDAVLEDLSVDLGLQVDGDHVAVLGGALDGGRGGEALTELLHRLVHVLVGDLDGVDLDLDAGVVRDLDGRADVDLGGEVQRLAVLQLRDVDLGLAQRAELRLVDRVGVELREGVVDRLLQDRTTAEALVDDPGRDLALAEALHRDLLVDLLVRRVEAVLELLEGHLDSEPNPGRVQGLHGALHGSVSLWLTSRVLPGPERSGRFAARRTETHGRAACIVTAAAAAAPKRRSRMVSRWLVGVAGFEPTAFRSQSGRATKLRHTPSGAIRRVHARGRNGRRLYPREAAPGGRPDTGCAARAYDPLRCLSVPRSRTRGAHRAGVAQW